jgi:hypothetical protein
LKIMLAEVLSRDFGIATAGAGQALILGLPQLFTLARYVLDEKGVYSHRVIGGHRNHCHSGGVIVASFEHGQGAGLAGEMHE